MRQHDDAVAAEMQVGLDGVRAGVHGAAEGGHGVLREGRLVAPVRDVLGQRRPGSRPGARAGAGEGARKRG